MERERESGWRGPEGHMTVGVHRIGWVALLSLTAAVALGIGAWGILRIFAVPLAVLIISITVAAALSPLVDWLSHRMRRTLAAVLVYLALAGILALAGWFLVGRIAEQAREFSSRLPEMEGLVRGWLQSTGIELGAAREEMGSTLEERAGGLLLTLPRQALTWVFRLIIIVFLSFYLLVLSPRMTEFFRSLFPEPRRREVDRVLGRVGHSMGGYVRGLVLDAIITGALAGFGLYLAGVDFPVLLGVVTLFGELVPYVGPVLAAIPAIMVGFLQSPTKALLALAVYTAVVGIEAYVLTPNVMRSQTDVSQPLVLLALFAGISVGGVLGMVAAIPLAGALRVLFLELVAPAIRRRTGAVHPEPRSKTYRGETAGG